MHISQDQHSTPYPLHWLLRTPKREPLVVVVFFEEVELLFQAVGLQPAADHAQVDNT